MRIIAWRLQLDKLAFYYHWLYDFADLRKSHEANNKFAQLNLENNINTSK